MSYKVSRIREAMGAYKGRITGIVAVALLAGTFGFAVEPSPVEARSVSCPISISSRLPTKAQFNDLVAAQPEYEGSGAQFSGARGGRWEVWAPISARCQAQLGKGTYMFRAMWTYRLQLESGWPIGRDYSESSDPIKDATLSDGLRAGSDPSYFVSGFSKLTSPYLDGQNLDYLEYGSMKGYLEEWTGLTERCFAERCTFEREVIGQFSSITGETVLAAYAFINMCFPYSPLGAEGEAETELCTTFGGDRYAHPGTFGMQVTFTGTITFEPLWTWRR